MLRIPRRTLSSVAVVVAATTLLLVPATQATAAPDRRGTTITLVGSNAELGLVDNGVPGSSLGDVRTLGLDLSRPGGRRVGSADVVQTLTDEGTVDRAVKVVVLTLPKGTISAIGLNTFPDFLDPTARPDDRVESIGIVGGTGAYRGAKGNVDIVVLPDFESRWIIHLR